MVVFDAQGELMTMVKFGANQIFRQKKSTVSKEDVDAIIERVRLSLSSCARHAAILITLALAHTSTSTQSMAKAKQAQQKVKKDMEHNLQTFK